jgi:hypothetical protein
LPSEETTPPVTNTKRVMGHSRRGQENERAFATSARNGRRRRPRYDGKSVYRSAVQAANRNLVSRMNSAG